MGAAPKYPAGVPTLDELARAPTLADQLAPSTVASLLGRAHVAIAALEARLLVVSIEQKEPPTADHHEPSRLMTAGEVAQRLSFTPGYVYELARAGKIKSLQQGKYIRFTEAALSEYIANNVVDPS
jgi:excisionase family DNA binding protein